MTEEYTKSELWLVVGVLVASILALDALLIAAVT